MKQQKKRFWLILLAALLLAGLFSFAAFATLEYHAEQPPTCTEPGYTAGAYNTETGKWEQGHTLIPSLGGHLWSGWTKADDAQHKRSCTRSGCSATETEAHKWDKGTVTKQATCSQPGVKTFTCSVCSGTKTESIAETGHKWSKWEKVDDKEHKRVCANDAAHVQQTDHNWGTGKVTKEATCTKEGSMSYTCSDCSAKKTEVIPVKAHDYKTVTTEPTCTEVGKTVYTCKDCKYSYEGDYKLPLGHDMKTDPAVDPTCEKEGKTERRYCQRVLKDEKGKDKPCGYVALESKKQDKIDHHRITEAAVAPTCMEEGKTERIYCDMCGKEFKKAETIKKINHKFVTEVITPATCTASGLSQERCEMCNESRTMVVKALGHDFQQGWIVEATCTSAGISVMRCTRCNEEKDQKNVKALGHDLEKNWTIEKAPTCLSAGSKSHRCARCGKAFDVTTMAKSGHNYKTGLRPATTKKNGKLVQLCKVCGYREATVIYKIASIELTKTAYTCDGTAKKPAVVVKNSADKKLVKGTDYKVQYESGRKKAGTYKVIVTFIGNYEGSKTLKFNIKLGKTKALKAQANKNHTVTLSYDKVVGAQKYCVYYATSKNGEYKKLTNAKKLTFTTGALTPGKVYYFRVRATAQKADGKNTFGAYSSVVAVKIK